LGSENRKKQNGNHDLKAYRKLRLKTITDMKDVFGEKKNEEFTMRY
jgi:hypothetical protein